MGGLLPWTYSYFIHSRARYRMESVFIFLLLLLGAWTIGYLIRLIGGPLELSLIHYALLIVNVLGMGVVFAQKEPDRIVLDCLTKQTASDASSQMDADTLYCSILNAVEHYDSTSNDEETCLAFAQQLVDVCIFELDLRTRYRWNQLFVRYWKQVGNRWLHATFIITVCYLQSYFMNEPPPPFLPTLPNMEGVPNSTHSAVFTPRIKYHSLPLPRRHPD